MGNYQSTPERDEDIDLIVDPLSYTKGPWNKYAQVAPSVCKSNGIKDVLSNPSENHNIDVLPNGCILAIIGSGYHIVNGFKPTPRGVVPAGERPDTTVTLEQTIQDIRNATEVKIRNNPLDKEKNQLTKKLNDTIYKQTELTNQEQHDEHKYHLLEQEKKEIEKQLKQLANRYFNQLIQEKQKVTNWLELYSEKPSSINVCFVREVLLRGRDEKAKPSWVSGLIQSENDKLESDGTDWISDSPLYVTKVIDLGSQKMSVVDESGCCTLNESFDFETISTLSFEQYIAQVKEAYPEEKIIARLTGKWRNKENETKKLDFISALQKAGIQADTLEHQKEAEYAALHTLNIIGPYYPDADYIFTEELGGGSFQATLFKQQPPPIRDQ